jgi:hypothetical protein
MSLVNVITENVLTNTIGSCLGLTGQKTFVMFFLIVKLKHVGQLSCFMNILYITQCT